jgi:anti-sigma factor RsiW
MADMQPLDDRDREQLSAYLDGEVDPKTARAIEAKVSLDAQARQELDSLRRTWDLLDYLPRPEPSGDFTHRTLERVAGKRPRPVVNWRSRLLGLAWAAAVLLAALGGFEGMRWHSRNSYDNADEQLVQDLYVIENARVYEHVDDIDFLHKLANPNDPDLFGDDNTGS